MPPKGKALLPLLVVFGIEHTIWPFYIYTEYKEYKPPFTKNSYGEIVDSDERTVPCNYDVQEIFETLKEDGVKIALVSNRGDFKAFEQLLELQDWNKYISYKQLNSEDFKVQFECLRNESGIDYTEMFFIDDKDRNVQTISKDLEIQCKLLPDGITYKHFEEAMKEYHTWKQGYIKSMKARERLLKFAKKRGAANSTNKATTEAAAPKLATKKYSRKKSTKKATTAS